VLGVAWFRIASAALVFAAWRRPWRLAARLDRGQLRTLVALGAVLAAMNTCFYLAIDRLPLSTVGAIEFLGTVILAAAGARTRRNVLALGLTTVGVAAVTGVRLTGQPLGFVLAFANCALFMLYVILGHRIASRKQGGGGQPAGQGQTGETEEYDVHLGECHHPFPCWGTGDDNVFDAERARGERDDDRITNAVFYRRHPDWKSKNLPGGKGSPAIELLKAEWKYLRAIVGAKSAASIGEVSPLTGASQPEFENLYGGPEPGAHRHTGRWVVENGSIVLLDV